MTLDAKTIAGLAVNAGFRGTEVTTAVAIALAESGGNPNAHNRNTATGDDSYGLWQINMLGSLGPARRRAFDIASNEALFNPTQNAIAAYKIYKSSGWRAWSVYKSGAYKSKLAVAETGVKANGGRPTAIASTSGTQGDGKTGITIGDFGVSVPDVGGTISNAVQAFSQSLFRMGFNAGALIVGVMLIIMAIVILLRAPLVQAVKGTAKVASNLTPGGRVATVAGRAAKVVS